VVRRACPPAERAHRGLLPYLGVMAGASLRREDREPTGYKSRPLSHAQADVVVRHWRLHGELTPPALSRSRVQP
jgi:hypothetical protein